MSSAARPDLERPLRAGDVGALELARVRVALAQQRGRPRGAWPIDQRAAAFYPMRVFDWANRNRPWSR